MRLGFLNRKKSGLTLLEVLLVIFVLATLAIVLFHASQAARRKAARIQCVNNLAQISLANRIWAGDHNDFYPASASNTNGGAMEEAATGNVAAVFEVLSNELGTPTDLICPSDTNHYPAIDFSAGFSANNISYFISLDVSEANPQMLLLGDDNFQIGDVQVKSGVLELPTNCPIAWTATRHKLCGNIAIGDGSVQQLSTAGLQNLVSFATNRLAIP